ncbi:SMP-LTD domain-containing protein [Entamoeba marina]
MLQGEDDWVSVNSNPYKLKSDCVVVKGTEEVLAVFGVEKGHILLKFNGETVPHKIRIKSLSVENIYFGHSKINRKNFIRISSSTELLPKMHSLMICFRYVYEFEFWYKFLRSIRRKSDKYSDANRSFNKFFASLLKLSYGQPEELTDWVFTVNYLLSKLFYTNSNTSQFNDRILTSLNLKLERFSNIFLPKITTTSINLGHVTPIVHQPKVRFPENGSGKMIIDLNLLYEGENSFDFETTLTIPLYFTTIRIPISLKLSCLNLRGISRFILPSVPTTYELKVGNKYLIPNRFTDVIFNGIVDWLIISKVLLPTMVRIPIPQISAVSSKKVETISPYVETEYTLPKIPYKSSRITEAPALPELFKSNKYFDSKMNINGYNKVKTTKGGDEKEKSFLQTIASKYFEFTKTGLFSKDFRTEKQVEKNQRAMDKVKEKQEKKNMKEIKKREGQIPIQIDNDNYKEHDKLSPDDGKRRFERFKEHFKNNEKKDNEIKNGVVLEEGNDVSKENNSYEETSKDSSSSEVNDKEKFNFMDDQQKNGKS